MDDVLNLNQVLELTKIPRSTLYHFMNNKNFPKPKKLGLRLARWSKKEILDWFRSQGFEIKD